MRVTRQAHEAVRAAVRPGETVIDATAGNGHDTCFLAECVGPGGSVIAIDVQAAALEETRRRLRDAGVEDERCELRQAGHEDLAAMDPGPVGAVMFNLGYLPGGDHTLVTRAGTTRRALDAALRLLRPGGVITVVAYPDHPGGGEEWRAVSKWARELDLQAFHVAPSPDSNRNAGPQLVVVSKLGASGARLRRDG
ncbi:MAG: class I SAM-dependent methyltransferase [Akkermansiaceae bacterium]|nr:class I SAM-dependent methyltransferase [Akkermansiaceae bacterium]NNM30995.1 class I SAM-dependent methyltransferase [Akkermansiaceae bacterium]